LPLLGMQYFDEAERTVCDDSCVRVDHSSYAARPAAIGAKVLVRIYAQRIEIRDLASGALLRTHAKAQRPGTVVLPMEERVFNPSRETRLILRQAGEIGEHASQPAVLVALCHRRKVGWASASSGASSIWPGATRRTAWMSPAPRRWSKGCTATSVLALTECIFAQAMVAIQDVPAGTSTLTQQHELIRDADEYADLFAHAAAVTAATTVATTNITTQGIQP
jgi:hypothetical protein